MAAASLSHSTLMIPKSHTPSSSLALHPFFKPKNSLEIPLLRCTSKPLIAAAYASGEFDMSIFEREPEGSDPPPPSGSGLADFENKPEHECPPGLRQYETMVILRPNMSEDERLAFTHKYEQLLVDGGAAHVEVLNGGVFPLQYGIRKRNIAGETNTFLDGIKLLFTYFTKPESISIIGETLQKDDNVIRSSSFKVKKRKLFRGSSTHCSM